MNRDTWSSTISKKTVLTVKSGRFFSLNISVLLNLFKKQEQNVGYVKNSLYFCRKITK